MNSNWKLSLKLFDLIWPTRSQWWQVGIRSDNGGGGGLCLSMAGSSPEMRSPTTAHQPVGDEMSSDFWLGYLLSRVVIGCLEKCLNLEAKFFLECWNWHELFFKAYLEGYMGLFRNKSFSNNFSRDYEKLKHAIF